MPIPGTGGNTTITVHHNASAEAADFSSLVSAGQGDTIDVSGAQFGSLQNVGDGSTDIDVSGAQVQLARQQR